MKARLGYGWRLFATGFCFAVFGVGGLLLWCFVFPLIRLLPAASQSRRIRLIIQKSFAAFLRLMELVGIMRMHVVGGEELAKCGGALVLANHPTLIDVVALVALLPNAGCVVKQALWRNPFLGGVVRAAGYISNGEGDTLIDDCARALGRGDPLIIFPEGTRTRPGEPLRFLRGAAYIAMRCERPVLPVLIDCRPTTLTKREKWYQIPPRAFTLRIEVRPPLEIGAWLEAEQTQTIAARKLTQAFENFFSEELALWTH